MTHREIRIIRGLPGSGKSHLLAALTSSGWDTYDDFSTHVDSGELLGVLAEIAKKDLVAIADVAFCSEQTLTHAIALIEKHAPDHVKTVCSFSNEPLECLRNVAARVADGDDREVSNFISTASPHYRPSGIIMPVWRKHS